MDVPIVDCKDAGSSLEDVLQINGDAIKRLGKTVVQTLKTYGFCYLKNQEHGVDEKLL